MTDVLVVSGEPLWPPSHGGRVRAAHLVEELARRLVVRVATPVEANPPGHVAVHPLPGEAPPTSPTSALAPSPRLGRALLNPARARALREVAALHRPRVVLFTHSYLAAVAPEVGGRWVVDFSDLEVRRAVSLAGRGSPRSRAAWAWESVKAARWEPRVARRAYVASSPSPIEVSRLSSWGARAVLVPNGAVSWGSAGSPPGGPVTFVASFRYPPNRDAATFLLAHVWPRLRRAEPGLRLRFVGRGAEQTLGPMARAEGIEVVGDPERTEPFYEEASMVLAPVRSGGGAQLKVTHALAAARVVVATSYSARAAPPSSDVGIVVADGPDGFAECVLRLWRDPGERHAREEVLVARRPVPAWDEACAPLVEALEGALAAP